MSERYCGDCNHRMKVFGIVKGPAEVFWRVWTCEHCGNVEKVVRSIGEE
jgi:transposase